MEKLEAELIDKHLTTSSKKVAGEMPYGEGNSASRVAEALLQKP